MAGSPGEVHLRAHGRGPVQSRTVTAPGRPSCDVHAPGGARGGGPDGTLEALPDFYEKVLKDGGLANVTRTSSDDSAAVTGMGADGVTSWTVAISKDGDHRTVSLVVLER